MSIKLVTKVKNSRTDRKAKVLHDTDAGLYIVKFYSNGEHEVDSDYKTLDLEDALSTVKFEMKREAFNKPKHKSRYAEKHAE